LATYAETASLIGGGAGIAGLILSGRAGVYALALSWACRRSRAGLFVP